MPSAPGSGPGSAGPSAGPIAGAIERALGRRVLRLAPLGGGCVAEVYRVTLADGCEVVVKRAGAGGGPALACEAAMLRYLAAHSALPVPALLHAEDDLLVTTYIEAGDGIDEAAEIHAAELVAALHGIHGARFGHERETAIGGLRQPNPPTERWCDFFRDHRLLYMARVAHEAKRLPAATMTRIERFAARLDGFIDAPARPSLIHGDLWAGNILVRRGRVVGLVDPALYYADPEIELAFATLFHSLGAAFFRRYGELHPLRPGFFEARRDIYNLYPLLVHTRLFGGHYVAAVERILARFGG